MQLYLVDPDSVLLRPQFFGVTGQFPVTPKSLLAGCALQAGGGISPPLILLLPRRGQRIFSISPAAGISALFSLYALVVNFIYCIAIYN